MSPAMRRLVAPVYLGLCLFLGGSVQGIIANAVLQVLGVGLIAWYLIESEEQRSKRSIRNLWLLALLLVGLFVVQLIPLPPSVWTRFPGRELVADGNALLGIAPGWMPISLAPYATLTTALTLIPPLAMLAAIFKLKAYSRAGLALAVLAATAAGVLLGVLQVSSSGANDHRFYLQEFVNVGTASGFFANTNHMATLLLIAIPMAAALTGTVIERTKSRRKRQGAIMLSVGAALVFAVGLATNGSLAGLGLAGPVLLLSFAMQPGLPPRYRTAGVGFAVAGVVAFLALLFTPLNSLLPHSSTERSLSTRTEIYTKSASLAADFAPLGSGLGTFEKVYPLAENPDQVTREYVNHAHSDYLEVAVEAGLPGSALLLLFLGWWFTAVIAMLRDPASDLYAQAGAIASGAVLIHSAVDFPLRTAAISAVFATALTLIVVSRKTAKREGDLRAARHVEVG